MDEELPIPEADDTLLDLRFIHWGYLNCCQTVSNGKKVKKEVWNTFWVDLCGSTIRLYKDSSLPPDSANRPPPVSQYGALQENELKIAFFELEGGKVTMLEDGTSFGKKVWKSPKVYRRHLFQVKFHKIRSSYVFQASSHSSILRWISKIDESIDAVANNRISMLVEDRLNFARFMMEKTHRDELQKEENGMVETADDVSETISIISESPKTKDSHPRLSQLKRQLREKRELLWQIEHQIISFLGNKGDFKRREFSCPIKQDYYLVPSRMDTYIPSGTNVTIFGQLPNRRWRCFIEMDELIKSMNKLVTELQNPSSLINPSSKENLANTSIASLITSASQLNLKNSLTDHNGNEHVSRLHISRNNLPDYPLIGSLPESILDKDLTEHNRKVSEGSFAPSFLLSDEEQLVEDEEETVSIDVPYSTHKRNSRMSPLKPWDTNFSLQNPRNSNRIEIDNISNVPSDRNEINQSTPNVEIIENQSITTTITTTEITNDIPIHNSAKNLTSDVSGSLFYPGDDITVNIEDEEEEKEEKESEEKILDNMQASFDESDLSTDTEDEDEESTNESSSTEKPILTNFSNGFLIRKKLRQKGISIIVGSSSSEDDDEYDDNNDDGKHVRGISNAVYRKLVSSNVPDENGIKEKAWNAEDANYIRDCQTEELKQSYSCNNINSEKEFTTKPDLLRRFGQKSIRFGKDKELAKALIQVFDETQKGPDVKPPRNERRTLKLSKNDEQGFGFWLQTYGFGKTKENATKRTFVRYVEDEGPAYLAGLREGDVIVEVNGQNVSETGHLKIVEYITESKKQLILVVKFMDAVRRVELAVRLKKKEAKLKVKLEELQKIKDEEKALLDGADTSSLTGSWALDLNKNSDVDSLSLSTSTESELSSISSLSSEEVTVRTSKFEKRSSRVLDSIRELNCIDLASNTSRSGIDLTSVTTENELLNVYSNKRADFKPIGRSRNGTNILKRVETMPVQKYRTLPRYKAVIDLDGNQAREYAIDNTMTGHISSESFETSYSELSLSGDGDNDDSVDESTPNTGISRQNRQSYKLAMKLRMQEGGSSIHF